jgi:uncharacterized protein with NRDE domain
MCTVSIVPHNGGVRVVANRDERRDRAAALDPRIAAIGSRAVALPIDPVAGGSWIGVNDAGLTAVLLNRHPTHPLHDDEFASRGAIVPLALGCAEIERAVDAALGVDASQFQPFQLVLVQRHRIAVVSGDSWDLAYESAALDAPTMFTASSLGDVIVEAPRRRLFEWLMNDPADRLLGQAVFHRHQWCDKRDISVLMERGDAATVSRTTIDVADAGVTLEYEALLPRRPLKRLEMAALELQPC